MIYVKLIPVVSTGIVLLISVWQIRNALIRIRIRIPLSSRIRIKILKNFNGTKKGAGDLIILALLCKTACRFRQVQLYSQTNQQVLIRIRRKKVVSVSVKMIRILESGPATHVSCSCTGVHRFSFDAKYR